MLGIRAQVRADALEWWSYRGGVFAEISAVIIEILSCWFLAKMVDAGDSLHGLVEGRGGYFPYAVTGSLTAHLMFGIYRRQAAVVREAQLLGNLGAFLTLDVSFLRLVLVAAIFPAIRLGSILCVVLSGIGIASIASNLAETQWLLTGIALFPVIAFSLVLCALPVGLLGAATVVLFRKGDPWATIFAWLGAFLGEAYFPRSFLHPSLQWLSELLPQRLGNSALRLALHGGHWGDIAMRILSMLGVAALTLPLALLLFHWSCKRALKGDGFDLL